MRHLLSAMIALACLLGATEALACREAYPRSDELAQRRIVFATVLGAERLESVGWNKWRVVAERTGASEATEDGFTYEFTVTLSSAGCGERPLPPKGERWVLYVDQGDLRKVLDAFPLTYARSFDARLADVP